MSVLSFFGSKKVIKAQWKILMEIGTQMFTEGHRHLQKQIPSQSDVVMLKKN